MEQDPLHDGRVVQPAGLEAAATDAKGLANGAHYRHGMRDLVYQAVTVSRETSNAGFPTR